MVRKGGVSMQNITDDLVAVTGIGPVIDELDAREEVLAIILFGSVARGRARPFSDIDLCVVTRNDLPEQERLDLQSLRVANDRGEHLP